MEYGKQNNLNVTSIKKNERSIACNAIIKKVEDGETYYLLGLRAKHKSGGGQWGLIGGTQEVGEFGEYTLARELLEEVNLEVNPDDIEWDNWFQCVAAEGVHFDHHGYVVDYAKCKGVLNNNEPNKCDELKWFKEEELPLDNFFVSKGNIINHLNGNQYDKKVNFDYRNQVKKNRIR